LLDHHPDAEVHFSGYSMPPRGLKDPRHRT
jgi:hypothetical protein